MRAVTARPTRTRSGCRLSQFPFELEVVAVSAFDHTPGFVVGDEAHPLQDLVGDAWPAIGGALVLEERSERGDAFRTVEDHEMSSLATTTCPSSARLPIVDSGWHRIRLAARHHSARSRPDRAGYPGQDHPGWPACHRSSRRQGSRDDLVHVRRAVDVLDEVGVRKCRGEMQIGGETDRRVPAVRNEPHAVLLRHPADAPLLARCRRLSSRPAARCRTRRACNQGGNACRRVSTSPPAIGSGACRRKLTKSSSASGFERLLEPGHVVIRQHLGGAQRPFEPVAARRRRCRRHRPSAGHRRRPRRARHGRSARRAVRCPGRTVPSRS